MRFDRLDATAMPGPLGLAFTAVFVALVVWAALKDATSLTIPNRLTLALAAAFVPAALAAGLPWEGWALALGTCGALLIVGMVLFALRVMGGGDAKLFAACGLWLGLSASAPFLLWTGVAGGVLATALLIGRNLAQYAPGFGPRWVQRLLTRGEGVPYGVAIAAGALAAFPASAVGRAFLGAGAA